MKKLKGFTLIELLIVVAIIAILAAIAVPNFMEAQVRAKVARVDSDMRTMATGIEAYTVDYNRGPIGANESQQLGLSNGTNKRLVSFSFLTTPVAYLTTILKDPFAAVGRKTSGGNYFGGDEYEYQYNNERGTGYKEAKARGYLWWVWSSGPTRKPINYWPPLMTAYPLKGANPPTYIYDSTNGTMSFGYITRTNKGKFLGND